MPNWAESMEQTFEYYTVDAGTWMNVEKLDNVISATISYDNSSETLGSMSIEATNMYGESYVRPYLVTRQNGVEEKFCLGTFLVQTPSSSFNGMYTDISIDAYTPLIELKEKKPPLGYYIPEDTNVMSTVYRLTQEYARAPVISANSDVTMYKNFVANADDTWLTFLSDAMANAEYTFGLDELGEILFLPHQDPKAMRPVWVYNDDNSSILYPDIDIEHDIYGIPNVIEVTYSDSYGTYSSTVRNDDPNSILSTVSRGREIFDRVSNPDIPGIPNQKMIDEYAEKYLKEVSTLSYTLTYSHGYCPVRIGDCVRLNYKRAGLNGVNALVTSQSVDCTPGCKVEETAIFDIELWG